VGTQVGNGLDVTVKYIDDKTGNVASAKWNKLDKATQDQIRGGGRILSVIVPAGTAGACWYIFKCKFVCDLLRC
jgi:hypothetical protein